MARLRVIADCRPFDCVKLCLLFVSVASVGICVAESALPSSGVPQVLRYDRPAEDDMTGWEERSLPLGNGWFGVSHFGGVREERLQITHNAFENPSGGGKANLTSALDLRLKFRDGRLWEYSRQLDLETAVSTVDYVLGWHGWKAKRGEGLFPGSLRPRWFRGRLRLEGRCTDQGCRPTKGQRNRQSGRAVPGTPRPRSTRLLARACRRLPS